MQLRRCIWKSYSYSIFVTRKYGRNNLFCHTHNIVESFFQRNRDNIYLLHWSISKLLCCWMYRDMTYQLDRKITDMWWLLIKLNITQRNFRCTKSFLIQVWPDHFLFQPYLFINKCPVILTPKRKISGVCWRKTQKLCNLIWYTKSTVLFYI